MTSDRCSCESPNPHQERESPSHPKNNVSEAIKLPPTDERADEATDEIRCIFIKVKFQQVVPSELHPPSERMRVKIRVSVEEVLWPLLECCAKDPCFCRRECVSELFW
ncbi:hypothetical protein CDAR_255101 [Caerostris darwini]|uniref:Uncharacterized protein n=1 Tax=Caerostris darwini TaxID=1538125 RepID=A0AAV4VBL6_9ARAC|nr:hypothetical protein CDAR_255101 [Caerostris darwini]